MKCRIIVSVAIIGWFSMGFLCGNDKSTNSDDEAADDPPVADFSMSPASGTKPLTVAFSDESTNDPTSWAWEFGDGGTSVQQNPSHIYNDAGNYTVKLTATNGDGSDSETKADCIVVTEPVAVKVSILPWYIVYAHMTTTYTDADSTWTVDTEGNTWPNWEPVIGYGTVDEAVTTITWDTVDGYDNPYSGSLRVRLSDDVPPVVDSFLVDAYVTEVGGWATRHIVFEGVNIPYSSSELGTIIWRIEGEVSCVRILCLTETLTGSGGGLTVSREITAYECNEESRVDITLVELPD